MIEITIEMLRAKVQANERRIEEANNMILSKQKDIALWSQENASFKASIRILESRIRE